MKYLSLLFSGIMLCSFVGTAAAQDRQDECYACHASMEDDASQAFATDVHRNGGLTCASCHGGDASLDDMDEGMSSARGFKGVPAGKAISATCGGCHDDKERMGALGFDGTTGQLTALRNSAHSRGSGATASPLMECTHCHGAHGIRPARDPASRVSRRNVVALCSSCHDNPRYMQQYNPSLPTDQLAKYRTSVHGQRNARGDSRAAACPDCHMAHEIRPASAASSSVNAMNIPMTCGKCHGDAKYMEPYGIPTNQLALFRGSVHGKSLLEKRDVSAPSCNDCHGNHGAAPPNVESIGNVCGTCHALNAELFRASRHAVEFEKAGYPECETCHGNHDVRPATAELLALGAGSLCGSCHSTENAPEGFRAAKVMHVLLDSLRNTVALAERRIDDAEQKGMEIEDVRFSLRDARQARLQARTAVHAFSVEKFSEVLDPGLLIARQALIDAEAANDDYYFRRSGLAIATLIITVTVILLFLYIRRIEQQQRSRKQAVS